MVMSILKLLLLGSIPVLVTVAFVLLETRSKFSLMGFWKKQVIIGIAFGLVAITGTEFGVAIDNAVLNVRDAAPLCAGLIFGGPAGIIAGCIGGLERWFAVFWGVGAFSRWACSISTVLAGIIAALLRKYIFDGKRPYFQIGFIIGFVMEVFHMTTLFITRMDEVELAYQVTSAATIPMGIANGTALMVALLLVGILKKELSRKNAEKESLNLKIQKKILAIIAITFVVTTALMFYIETKLTEQDTKTLLGQVLDDVTEGVKDDANRNILKIARLVASVVDVNTTSSQELDILADVYNLADICIVDHFGLIVASNNRSYLMYNMASEEQSAEFLVLLDGETKEYVQDYQPTGINSDVWRKFAGCALEGGFVQVAYNEVQMKEELVSAVEGATSFRHIDNEGFVLILDSKQRAVSAPSEREELIGNVVDYSDQGIDFSTQESRKIFTVDEDGEKYYCMLDKAEGYYVIAYRLVDEANKNRDFVSLLNSYKEVLIFVCLFLILLFLIRRQIVEKIQIINGSLRKITEGDLEEVVDVRSSREFDVLSTDINKTVSALKGYIKEAETRMEKELQLAKDIQMSALPSEFPPFPERKDIDLHASMRTAKEVGGDFYDYYWLDSDRLVILIADVSGKGIPAAMFMMRGKTILKSYAEMGLPVHEAVARANDKLCEGNDAGMFITAWMAYVNVKTGHVEFANAGHNPPLIRHGDGSFQYLKSRAGLVLAGMSGIPYRLQEFDLEPGSAIYLYTDGVTEATDANNQLYGDPRLEDFINTIGSASSEKYLVDILENVDKFVGEAPQFDDITMLILQLKK